MKTLVIYDSQYGNTERIAQAIANALATFGPTRVQLVKEAAPPDLEGVDLVIVGSPTQGWRATEATREFIAHVERRGMAAAAFDTRFHKSAWLTGSAAKNIAKGLRQQGEELLAPPESFFVEKTEGPLEPGEVERAADWARALAAGMTQKA